MNLVGYNWTEVLLGILYVSLAIILIVIGYRKLLAYLGRGMQSKADFCVLYPLDKNPVSGEVEFYFTTEVERDVRLLLLDENMKELQVINEKKATSGGNIVRFDSLKVSNGDYYYCLMTENQKTMKKMTVMNP